MYSTCLFCHRSLGGNDLIEHFPVGRRLAFDSAKGRLWVVCAGCGQWNLTPLEERWEAVEECERRYERARRRVSTDQIGLARVADRLDLVRIGSPLRPEFASWRYGDRFRARAGRAAIAGASVLGVIAALTAVGFNVGAFMGSAGSLYYGVRKLLNRRSEVAHAEAALKRLLERRLGLVKGQAGIYLIPGRDASSDWGLRIAAATATVDLYGSDALHTAHLVLPVTNPQGAWSRSVRRAVGYLEEAGDPRRFFATARDLAGRKDLATRAVHEYPAPIRLAVEMAAHEESERLAMQGDLATLEGAWREAEEIAAIADDMFLPSTVTTTLERLRRRQAPRVAPE